VLGCAPYGRACARYFDRSHIHADASSSASLALTGVGAGIGILILIIIVVIIVIFVARSRRKPEPPTGEPVMIREEASEHEISQSQLQIISTLMSSSCLAYDADFLVGVSVDLLFAIVTLLSEWQEERERSHQDTGGSAK
jgi:hypothetical protein